MRQRRDEDKCRHFTGLMSRVCEAGVNYDDVKTVREPRGSGIFLPCFNEGDKPCSKQSLYTPEEAREREARHKAAVDEFCRKIESGLCVECGIQYTPTQLGRCVYAKECGHRQFQGKADPKMSDEEYEAQAFAYLDALEDAAL